MYRYFDKLRGIFRLFEGDFRGNDLMSGWPASVCMLETPFVGYIAAGGGREYSLLCPRV